MANTHKRVHCVVQEEKELWEIVPVWFQHSAFHRTQRVLKYQQRSPGPTAAVNKKIFYNTTGKDPYILLYASP